MSRPGGSRIARITTSIAVAGALVCAAAAAFVYSGAYDVSATSEHTAPVYWLMERTMRRSVSVRADERTAPDLSRPETIEGGLRQYQARCVQCHGAPGIAPEAFALGMTPVPSYLVATARNWSAAEIYWVVKNGIKMTGMPASKYRMSDEEIGQVVAFVKHRLPYLSAQQYRDLMKPLSYAEPSVRTAPSGANAEGDPRAGRRAIQQYACAACHVIPGVTGATQEVGPPLRGIAKRTYIAGLLPNTPENMTYWIMFPQRVSQRTAMPDLGVKEQDARDIAAYLTTLTAE